MLEGLLAVLVILPILAGLLVFILRNDTIRSGIVLLTAVILTIGAIKLFLAGPFAGFTPEGPWGKVITFLDFGLLFVLLYIAFRLKNIWIAGLTLAQIALISYFDFVLLQQTPATNQAMFFADQLSLTMVLIVSIIGSLIALFAIPYMADHEKHLHLSKSKQPQFFAIMLMFLGAMNALVLANDLVLLVLAWEVTTLCSFLLISHDGTQVAIKNATRALLLNSVGGVALALGLTTLYMNTGASSFDVILNGQLGGVALLLPIALFCFAGFTKAAQMPFQSWLLGAMVAPTPVSALLHSSTMVKAGVYMIVRLAPAYAGTMLSDMIALVGAFTFVATSALAVSQSNGKKVLAYSTIANLGLIVVAAGINTPVAYAAAILLIVFHAISKALLFLCVGTIEHGIGSRDLEDMHGLYQRMPFTSVIALVGMITMFLPPFGMLLGKWATLEAAPRLPIVVVLLAFGSALTMVFWLRWAGNIMSTSAAAPKVVNEQQPLLIKLPLALLASSAVVLSVLALNVYQVIVAPMVAAYYTTGDMVITAVSGQLNFVNVGQTGVEVAFGNYALWPLFAVVMVSAVLGLYALTKASSAKVSAAYMCGEIADVDNIAESRFRGHHDQWHEYQTSNYYLESVFGEGVLTKKSNIIAIVIIAVLFGVVLI